MRGGGRRTLQSAIVLQHTEADWYDSRMLKPSDTPPAAPPPHAKRWLPWLALTTSICTLIYYYLNLRHWRNPGEDQMAVAFGIVVTTLLWGLLIVSSILNLKDRWRGKRHD